jgi:integrase
MTDFIDMRLRRVKKKSSLRQEVSVIKGFYNSYLIKKGFVFKIPEIPEFTSRKDDNAKREDTFNLKEWEKLYKFMREWVKPKNVSKIRIGKKENKEKVLNDWEYQMEIHRRIIIRELILIGGSTGLRLPSEILSLKWGDIKVKKEKFAAMFNPEKEVEQLVAVIKVGKDMKTGARIAQGIAGSYFKRLKAYYRNELDYEPKDNDYVFMEFFGRRKFNALDRYALYRIWGELIRDCGLNRIDFQLYHLRHLFITQSILNGVDLLLISKNCGNSPNTIFNHYEHVEMEKQTQKLLQRRNTRKEMENEIEI